MNNTISVIIPVYNVESYLRQCLDSVLSQSYSSLQVILIDDGSTDTSGDICDEYVVKDPRVVVLHQKNGGAAKAKNAGLRIASGKYLSFVDSDDFLDPNAYMHMAGLLASSGADVIQCSYREVFRNTFVPHILQKTQTEFPPVQYLGLFTKDWTCGLLWDKLYVRSIFNNVWFEEGHKIDDEYFTYRGIMNANKIIRDDTIIYNYRKRRSSVMYSPESGSQIVKDRIDYLSKRRKTVITRFPELREVFDRHFVEMMVILSRDSLATKDCCTLIRMQLLTYLKERGHTRIDIRLWPALAQIGLGLAQKNTHDHDTHPTDMGQYFD